VDMIRWWWKCVNHQSILNTSSFGGHMKRSIRATVVMVALALAVNAGLGQVPHTLSYQGFLTGAGGDPVPDGSYGLAIRIYSQAIGGTPLWGEILTVIVQDGIFNAILGKSTALNLGFDEPYWLGVAVGTGAELFPRTELTATAYSLHAAAIVDSIVTGRKIANGQVIRSLNGLRDNVKLSAGSNVSIATQGDSLVISSLGGGGGSTPWQIAGSHIYFNGGNAGIGTNTPTEKLDVAGGDIRVRGALRLNPEGITLAAIRKAADSSGEISTRGNNGSANVVIGSAPWNPNYGSVGVFDNSGTLKSAMLVDPTGVGTVTTNSLYTNSAVLNGTAGVNPLEVKVGSNSKLMVHNNGGVSVGSSGIPLGNGLSVAEGVTAKSAVFDAASGADPLIARVDGSDKFKVHDNGGVSVGSGALPPAGGLIISADNGADALNARINLSTKFRVHSNGGVSIGSGTIPQPDALFVLGGQISLNYEYIRVEQPNEMRFSSTLLPHFDNALDLGNASYRWDDVYATNGTIQTSDIREKTNVQNLSYGLKELMQMRPVRYQWKNLTDHDPKIGLIAQELLPVVPEVVKTHEWKRGAEVNAQPQKVELERLGVYYTDLIPVLIKAIQEQQGVIEQLVERVHILESEARGIAVVRERK